MKIVIHFWKPLRFVLLVWFILFVLLCFPWFQRNLLFHPTHWVYPTTLQTWTEENQYVGLCKEVKNPRKIWLFCSGNAGQADFREYILSIFDPRDSVYLLEYPGFGARTGSPSMENINNAALEAYDQLKKRFPQNSISVASESLGSSPACTVAQLRQPNELVLFVPFDNLQDVAAETFFMFPVRWIMQESANNIQRLQHYDGPIQIFGAQQDNVIPYHHAKNLAQTKKQAQFTLLPTGHNTWFTAIPLGRF